MSKQITVGVLALTDSAPFVVASHLGLFDDVGLKVTLSKQPSWATLRDKLLYGDLDAAHMLSPLAIAVQLGLRGSPRKAMSAPVVLNRGGNAITVSNRLKDLMAELAEGETLGSQLRKARAAGAEPLVFGSVFPFSMHTLQLRRWLRLQDVDPSDVHMEIVAPARMVQALRDGFIDGFCVGEPWNSMAVREGLGHLVSSSVALWPNAPEKVLGCTREWAQMNREVLEGLCDALGKACVWLESGLDHRRQAAHWLSEADYVNVPHELLELALTEQIRSLPGASDCLPEGEPFIRFDGQRIDHAQQPAFEQLLVETLMLAPGYRATPESLALGLSPFGF